MKNDLLPFVGGSTLSGQSTKKRIYNFIYHLMQVMPRLWSTKYLLASLKLQPNYIYLEQLIHKMNLQFYTAQQFWLFQPYSHLLYTKQCNQVYSLSLSRWRTLTLLKIEIGWEFWCFKLQTIVSYGEEYCESMQSWLKT